MADAGGPRGVGARRASVGGAGDGGPGGGVDGHSDRRQAAGNRVTHPTPFNGRLGFGSDEPKPPTKQIIKASRAFRSNTA